MNKKQGILAAVIIAAVILIGASVYLAVTSSHKTDEIESTSGTVLETELSSEPETEEETVQAVSPQEETTTAVSTTIKPAKTTAKAVPQTKETESTTLTTVPDTGYKMTMAQFDRIEKGMTYEQVLEIAGMPPKSSEEINGEFVCHWDAEGQLYPNGKPPVATVQFQNGRVHSKICLRLTPKDSN